MITRVRFVCLAVVLLTVAGCSDGSPEGSEPLGDPHVHLLEVPDEGQAALAAELDIPFGTVSVGEAESGTLFQAEVSIPFEDVTPALATSLTRDGRASVQLSLGGSSATLEDLRRTSGTTWSLLFSRVTPTDLEIRLGAAEASLDLTGIPLRSLDLATGLARTSLTFSAPNSETMSELNIKAGVSSFEATGLGNARFERFSFSGGVGSFDIDLSGDAHVAGADVSIEVGVGKLEVTLPRFVPLVLRLPRSRATSIDIPDGLVSVSTSEFVTEGAAGNSDAMKVTIGAGPGSVRIRWADS